VFSSLSVIPEDGTTPVVDAWGLHIQVELISDRRVEQALVSKLPEAVEE
jgi:putative hemolysin